MKTESFPSCRIFLSTQCPFIGHLSFSAREMHAKGRLQKSLLFSPDPFCSRAIPAIDVFMPMGAGEPLR